MGKIDFDTALRLGLSVFVNKAYFCREEIRAIREAEERSKREGKSE